jgi:hypothetical protein
MGAIIGMSGRILSSEVVWVKHIEGGDARPPSS